MQNRFTGKQRIQEADVSGMNTAVITFCYSSAAAGADRDPIAIAVTHIVICSGGQEDDCDLYFE